MATLLLRLSGPLQSWGSDSRFDTRNTNREPTKSGVIGLIAAALGIKREESTEKLGELNSLKFAVRVDKEGELLKDFHIAKSQKSSYVTNRYYLSDATFLVALESDNLDLIKKIALSVQNPVFPLFLGRKSCPPTLPIVVGIENTDALSALKNHPLLCKNNKRNFVRYICETNGDGRVIGDVPVSFSQKHRRYGYRKYAEEISVINSVCDYSEHDPMAEL